MVKPITNNPPVAGKRELGKVVRWNAAKAYGFIEPASGAGDVFVHVTGLTGSLIYLEPDQRVSYILVRDKRGKMVATGVELAR
jgi:cold shock protein